jgi:hypothetical protein
MSGSAGRSSEPRYASHSSLKQPGYLVHTLRRDGKNVRCYAHNLVAEAFIGERPIGHHVNHIDGNKHNNHASNLEYVTPARNIQHAYEIGLNKGNKGEQAGRAILTEEQVNEIRLLRGKMTQAEIGKLYGVGRGAIANIMQGKTWKHV